jgi:ribA/ribD-fused uncharacterized protein
VLEVKVGDKVQWTVNGMDQFSIPRVVERVSDCGTWCFVGGSDTGMPVDQVSVLNKEQFTLFYSGPFSQWHPSRFTVNNVTYSHAEQYMMASKARLFNDPSALRRIMESNSPDVQKATGRRVKNFDETKWNLLVRDFVYNGNKAKFTQNAALREKLLATKGTTLVEASPKDRLWGIGLHISDPRCYSRETWRGKNWLGETLTRLRDDLIKGTHDA